MPTIDELDQALKDLKARVNQIDGIGVVDPSNSALFQIYALINSSKSDIRQVVLTLEAELQKLKEKVTELKGLVDSHLGV